MSELTPPNACIDIPDPRDYHYLEVFGVWEMPKKVENNRTSIYNQGAPHVPITKYWCTCYSATHCVNEGNALEAEKFSWKSKETDPVGIWAKALERWANIKTGWSLQWASNLVKDLWCISGYTICRSLGEVKQALASGQMIQTGSKSIDWAKTRENNNIVVAWSAYWHAFMLEGYDDETELLTFRNSYWPKAYSNGRFFMHYKDFWLLFSCYAYTDSKSPEIRNYQAMKRRAIALSRGIYNWKDDNINTIRQDAAAMAERTGPKRPVWNKKNPMMPVTRWEFKTMLERSTGKKILFNIWDKYIDITRGEAAEWCVRI